MAGETIAHAWAATGKRGCFGVLFMDYGDNGNTMKVKKRIPEEKNEMEKRRITRTMLSSL